jgi:hypothetical protein
MLIKTINMINRTDNYMFFCIMQRHGDDDDDMDIDDSFAESALRVCFKKIGEEMT